MKITKEMKGDYLKFLQFVQSDVSTGKSTMSDAMRAFGINTCVSKYIQEEGYAVMTGPRKSAKWMWVADSPNNQMGEVLRTRVNSRHFNPKGTNHIQKAIDLLKKHGYKIMRPVTPKVVEYEEIL